MTSAVPAPRRRSIERRASALPTTFGLVVATAGLLTVAEARAAPADDAASESAAPADDAAPNDAAPSDDDASSDAAPSDDDASSDDAASNDAAAPSDDAAPSDAAASSDDAAPSDEDPTPETDVDDAPETSAAGDDTAPSDAPDTDAADIDAPGDEDADGQADAEPEESIRPPRFDGPYVGVVAFGTASFASVIDLDTPAPLFGTTGFLQAGDAVFPWMSIGIAAGGGGGWVGDQQMFVGALLVEFGFAPIKRHPFTIRTGFGFGGGAIDEPDVPRAGFGGALFKASVRYEFFPLAERKRPTRGGGWAIGPELGWLGATPAGPGQPFVNTILLGVSTSFYFGS